MSEEVTPKTFDLAAALSGIDYPSVNVEVYFNEALAYQIAELNEQLNRLSMLEDKSEYNKMQKKFDSFISDIDSHKFVFHIKGIPAHVENSIIETVKEQYPTKRNALGIAETDNVEADTAYMELMLQAYIHKITAPDGSVINAPSIEDIKTLRKNSPAHVIRLIENAIIELKNKVVNGFELGIKSADFLSKP